MKTETQVDTKVLNTWDVTAIEYALQAYVDAGKLESISAQVLIDNIRRAGAILIMAPKGKLI